MKSIIKMRHYIVGIALFIYLLVGDLSIVNATNLNVGSNESVSAITLGDSADVVIVNWIQNILTFLYLAAVAFGIWGGFNILSASGDEEKVKKGKTIIIQAMLGIVVIFLAGSIVEWLINLVLQPTSTGSN